MTSEELAIGGGGFTSAGIQITRVGVLDYFTMEHLWNARHSEGYSSAGKIV
jgi:hypothetical protein